VFGASPEDAPTRVPEIRTGDLVIAADGGWRLAAELNLSCDVVVGDFDSAREPTRGEHSGELVRLPVEKDVTDMFAAVQIGYERGYRHFALYGGFGGRFDHTLANLQTLLWLARRGASAELIASTQVLTVLHSDGGCPAELELGERTSGTFSVFAFGGAADGVSILGARYELRDSRLSDEFALGVSNEFIGVTVRISVTNGSLLIVQPEAHD
jgi:thiamine pyrophosphokinase